MKIKDRIYGSVEVVEQVIIDLLGSSSLARLKGINQAGPSKYLYPWKNISRYDHSIGVMLLLKSFGASLEAQIAGLLHDLPHTAFSHVIDYVFESEDHTYHEKYFRQMVETGDIVHILKSHNIAIETIDPEKHPLLERPIPDICADRIDYALRDHFAWTQDFHRLQQKLNGLSVFAREFVFKDKKSAKTFTDDYLRMDETSWSTPRELAIYKLLALAIKYALDQRILTHEDLFTEDDVVIDKLKTSGDRYIAEKLAYLTSGFHVAEGSPALHDVFVKPKVRYVDPKIIVGGSLRRLSEVYPEYLQIISEHTARSEKGRFIRVFR